MDQQTPRTMQRDVAQRAYDMVAGFVTPEDAARGVAGMRDAYERLLVGFPVEAGTDVDPVDANGVPCLVVRAPSADAAIRAIHFHGGGYMVGSAKGSIEYAARVSKALGAAVLVVDYRLAPEYPFPAAVEDARAAYAWLCTQTSGPLFISGESAGGGLAMALGMACRDAGDVRMPVGYFVLSPFADLTVSGESVSAAGTIDPFANADMLTNLAAGCLQGQDARTSLASPIYGDLSGLAPVLMACSEVEALRSDAERLQAALVSAGVVSRLIQYPDTLHIFAIFPFLPESDAVMAALANFGAEVLEQVPTTN